MIKIILHYSKIYMSQFVHVPTQHPSSTLSVMMIPLTDENQHSLLFDILLGGF